MLVLKESHFMKLTNPAAIGLIAALAVAQAPAQTVRVGTFHKASIVVAFYRSPLWAVTLTDKKLEMEKAKAASFWGTCSTVKIQLKIVAVDIPIV